MAIESILKALISQMMPALRSAERILRMLMGASSRKFADTIKNSPCERPIREQQITCIPAKQGSYTKIDTPEFIEIARYPIFGSSRFTLNLKRPLPPRHLAVIKSGLVHGDSTAVMTRCGSGGIHWIMHRELSLGKNPICYAEHFKKIEDSWFFSQRATLEPTMRLNRAVLVGGRFSFNYFHFIVDTLVRLLIAELHLPGDRSPLLVPKLHPKMMEMLSLLVSDRAIVSLAPNDLVEVDELIIASAADFSPDDPQDVHASVYDALMLPALRERLQRISSPSEADVAKTVFIRRRTYKYNDGTQSRSLANQEEVIDLLRRNGAVDIEPDTLSVADQKRIFSEAEVVFGLAGAAMGNMIYCKPGTSVVVLLQNSNSVSSEYFGFMAQKLGLRYAAIACEAISGTSHHPSHLSVRANLNDVSAALAWARPQKTYAH